MLFIDIETSHEDDSLVCVGWAYDDGPLYSASYLPEYVRATLADPDEVVVTHTGFDVRYLHFNEGVDVRATQHDTQVMAWLVNENLPLGLDDLSLRYLGTQLDKSLQKMAGVAPYADIAAYCEKDVETTRELYRVFKQRLIDESLWDYFDTTEAPFTKVLRDMEFRGLPVDLPATKRLGTRYRKTAEGTEVALKQDLPSCFNVRSPKHVAKYLGSSKFTLPDRQLKADNSLNNTLNALAGTTVDAGEGLETDLESVPAGTFITLKSGRLYDHGVWVVKGRATSGFDDALATVARPDLLDSRLASDPWVVSYLRFKKYDKLVSTYTDVFQERAVGGRLYGRFNQTGTTTGRLSSSEPNLQNIPSRGTEGKEIRDLFRGNLVVGDFSQLEPRLMAHFSQDQYMMDAFAKGKDLYQAVANAVRCPRDVAKTLVLAMSYGAGPDKVAQTLHLNGFSSYSSKDAAKLLKKLSEEYHTYFMWREKVIAQSKFSGCVQTIDGRLRRIERGGQWNHKDPSAPGRQAANAIVQGSAADIVRRVMLHVTRMFPDLHLLAQVHDELVWEYDPATPPDLKKLNEWVLRIAQRGVSVPLVFEAHAGTSWYRAKEGI